MKTLLALLGGISASFVPTGVIIKQQINNIGPKAAVVDLQMPDMSNPAYLDLWETEFQQNDLNIIQSTKAYSNSDYGFQLARDVKQQVTAEDQEAVRNLSTVQSYNLINKQDGEAVFQIQSKGKDIVKMHTLESGEMVFDDVKDTALFSYEQGEKDYLTTSIIQYINGNNSFVNRYVAGWSNVNNSPTGSVKVFDGYEERFLDIDFKIPETMTVDDKELSFKKFLNVFSNTKTDGTTTLYIAGYFSGSSNAIGVFDYDLTNKIDPKTGEFDSEISEEVIVNNRVWWKNVSTWDTQDFIFFADPKGYTSFLYSGDLLVGTKIFTENTNNDENKPFEKEIYFEDDGELNSDTKITSVITTQHRLKNPDYKDYVVFSANNLDTSNKEAKLWYIEYDEQDPFKVRRKELFNFNLFEGENKAQNENGKVTNLISYYNNEINEYKISLTTDKAVYSYIYKSPTDFGSSHNSIAVKELLINSGIIEGPFGGVKEAMFKINAGSLNYINGELVFLLGTNISAPFINSKTWYGNLYQKYDISTISLSNQTLNFTPSSNENDIETNVQELKNAVIDEFKAINSNVGMMFKQATSYEEAQNTNGQEYLWDYKVDISNQLANQFFPANQFGNIDESAKISILSNDTKEGSWAAKFKGQNQRHVNVSYTNAYDLVDLVEEMNSLYKNKAIVSDDFNHIIGQIYNNIGDHLNEVIRIKNQEYPIFSKNEEYWQINNWEGQGPIGSTFDANNWGFFNGDNVKDENGYYTRTLDNINIKISSKAEKNNYFLISESENTHTDDKGNIYVTLKPIMVKYKSTLIGRDVINDQDSNLKLDMKYYAKKASEIQFDGRGFDINSKREALEYMLNQNRSLGNGIGYAISADQFAASNLQKGSTTMKVYIYDKAFKNPNDEKWYLDENAEIVEILILGLTENEGLPSWVIPTLVLGGTSLLIMTIMTVWFIGRKRFYKKAIGKEGAKIASSKMKEEKLKLKIREK